MNDPKTERLTLRLTPAQRELLEAAAAGRGESPGEFAATAALARARAATAPAGATPGGPEAAGPPAELTLRQAAAVLNASPAHVKGLLEQGRVAHRGRGARLRVDRDALLEHKARDDRERRAALDELARDAQEQGYGY